MKPLRTLFGVAVATLALIASAGVANATDADHSPDHNLTCWSGNIASGTYSGLTVSGKCTIADGATVTVRGDVKVQDNAQLNAMTASTVHIDGNVWVGDGATLSLGCSEALTMPPFPGGPVFCTGVSHDRVDGNITADEPWTLKINGITVNGNIVSHGGGQAVTGPTASTCEEQPAPLNFPIKDNTINGKVVISGWQGCWIGYIRNVQHGNAVIVRNKTADSDSTEIVTNTIRGNLICKGNSPAPQIGDSVGMVNTVAGHKAGQCTSL